MTRELVLSSDFHEPGKRKLEAVRAAAARDVPRLVDLLNTYLTYRGRRGAQTSDRTRRTYETALRDWVAHCWPNPGESPTVPLLRATESDVERYLALLQQRVSAGSAATYLGGLRAFYRALVWAGATAESPAADVRSPVDPRPKHERRDAVPLDGYRAMLELAGVRDALILRVLGDQGLRISEAAALDLADVRGRIVTVQSGKGGKRRRVPMTPATTEALAAWLDERDAAEGETALFVNPMEGRTKAALRGRRMSADSIRRAFHELRRAAGLPDGFSPHGLRHTALTRVYRSTRDLHVTSRIAGHASVDTTSIYAHMDLGDLEDAMGGLDDL